MKIVCIEDINAAPYKYILAFDTAEEAQIVRDNIEEICERNGLIKPSECPQFD